MSEATIFSAALLLFLVIDPVGNIPMFVAALKDVAPERRARVVVRESLIALGVLVAFLFLGRFLLELMGLTQPALTTGGGIILFLIALRMVFPPARDGTQVEFVGEPLIVPLAIPYIAGPSAMASVLMIMSHDNARWASWLTAVVLAWGLSAAILVFATKLSDRLGKRGLTAVERLMGMILVAIAVQMIMQGVAEYWTGLGAPTDALGVP